MNNTQQEIMNELKVNILDEVFNFSDSSVGIEWVSKITLDIAEDYLNGDDLKLLSYTNKNAIIECEGFKYEIYLEANEEYSEWKIKAVS